MRKTAAIATMVLALTGTVAAAPSATAATTYACHYSGGPYPYPTYAGHYTGTTYVPVYGNFSKPAVEAQCLVRVLGFDPGATDGVYGAKTVAAIKGFQHWADTYQHAGLAEDGYVGPSTWPLLREYASN